MSIRSLAVGVVTVAALGIAGCGSSGPSSPSGDAGNDGAIAATLTITAGGITPKTVTVPLGSRITIVNNDSRTHDMNSDPHPEHTSCPPLNNMGMTPGQSRTSQNLTTARTCGIHDHNDADNPLWRASITVQ